MRKLTLKEFNSFKSDTAGKAEAIHDTPFVCCSVYLFKIISSDLKKSQCSEFGLCSSKVDGRFHIAHKSSYPLKLNSAVGACTIVTSWALFIYLYSSI